MTFFAGNEVSVFLASEEVELPHSCPRVSALGRKRTLVKARL